jgi:hypothetical protein
MNRSKLLFVLVAMLALNPFSAQKTETVKGQIAINSPLRQIQYMATSVRYSYGLTAAKLNSSKNWSTQPGTSHQAALGWAYSLSNTIGADVQLSYESHAVSYRNQGVLIKTGYKGFGVEIGAKKFIPQRWDNTFFIRAAFGYNFGLSPAEGASADYFSHSGNTASSATYAMPEVGYQFRVSNQHLIDVSCFYHYGFRSPATTNLLYIDPINPSNNESAVGTYNGRFLGFSVKYSYLFWGSKKLTGVRKGPTDKF